MGRLRFTGLIAAVVACAALCAPAASSAANSFSWSQPGDFTATGSGANPEHTYGEPSWSYSASGATLGFSSSFAGAGGTYAGWVDSSSSPTTWIATGTAQTLQMVPAKGGSVALTWTSPFPSGAQVTVSGSVTEPNVGTLACVGDGTNWTLTNGQATVASGVGESTATISGQTVTVAAGATLKLAVSDSSLALGYSTSCDDTEVALALSAPAPASAITLTSPTSNQSFTSGQPTLSGAAGDGFGYDSQVKVRVYSGGGSVTGTPLQTLTASESGGRWSVPANALVNGTYTAQAEQDDVLGDVDLSTAVTFTVANPHPPTVTLNSLGSAPLSTSTPTLTGTAGTAAGDSDVDVTISSGPVVSDAMVVRSLTVPVAPGGGFTVAVAPALADGQYTAVAQQLGPGGAAGESAPVTFEIQAHPSALTLTSPAAGSSLGQSAETFSGSAGTVVGDANTVKVTIWRGTSAKGKPLGSERATVSGSTWTVTWSKRLPLGLYTVQASQSDAAGHTALTAAHTFLVVPAPSTIGSAVVVDRGGQVSLPISCLAPAGTECRGTVLVLTERSFQPAQGGPSGPLRVLFAYVGIPGGHTIVIRRDVQGAAKRILLRKAPLQVKVTTSLSVSGAGSVTDRGTRALRATS